LYIVYNPCPNAIYPTHCIEYCWW